MNPVPQSPDRRSRLAQPVTARSAGAGSAEAGYTRRSGTGHRGRSLTGCGMSSSPRCAATVIAPCWRVSCRQELVLRSCSGLRLEDVDWAAGKVWVISKGTRLHEPVPVSPEALAYLAAYLDEAGLPAPGQPLWRTRRGAPRPLTYWALRQVMARANEVLGTNWSLSSRPGARCRCCHRSVSPGRSPNPPCRSLRNGLSTVAAVRRGSWVARGWGSCCPGSGSG